MSPEQLLVVLGGFISTLIGIVYFMLRWATRRMDVKDERYAKTTKEDRDEFLGLMREYRNDTKESCNRHYDSTMQFTEAMQVYGKLIEKTMGDWEAALDADRINRESFQAHVHDEHEVQAGNQKKIAESLDLIVEILTKMTQDLGIKPNGDAWNGTTERRS
jgi:hypothetical protein